jgi:hypothetical protein
VFGYWRRRSDCYFILLTTSLLVTTISLTMGHELVPLCSHLSRWLQALAHCLLLRSALIDSSAVEISPLIVELRGLVREHLVQGFSFVFNSTLASVASGSNNSVSGRCIGNVNWAVAWKWTSLLLSDFNIPAFRHCLPSGAQQWSLTSRCLAMDVL